MFQSHLIRRTFHVGACGAAILLGAVPGKSEPDRAPKMDKRACTAAYKSARERQQNNRLREAQELLLSCAKVACGAFLKQECATKYNQLDNDIPSIVPIVTDDSGAPPGDVQVKMDGELLASKCDGRALPVDPGTHEFTFITEKGVVATQKILIAQGQRNRPIAVSVHTSGKHVQKSTLAASVAPAVPVETVEPNAAPEKTPLYRPAPRNLVSEKPPVREALPDATSERLVRNKPGPLPFVIGGAGLAAVGTGALLIFWGKKDNDALGQCSPDCLPSTVSHIRAMYTAADISIGVGVAALGVATYLFANPGHSREKPPAHASYSFDVTPTPTGAFASVSGAF